MTRSTRLGLAVAVGLTFSPLAHALEVQFEGSTRARLRVYDSLSMDRSLDVSEGMAAYVQHRLWLRPKFLVNDRVGVYMDVRGLDGVLWGDQPAPGWDALSNGYAEAVFTEDLASPTSDYSSPDTAWDAAPQLRGFALWRAWGEVDTSIGSFALGRMPVHWGMGVWHNDGLGPQGEYGDTVDRLQWEHLIDQVWLSLAIDVNNAGILNQADDTLSYNGSVMYRSERIHAGFSGQLRRVADPGFTLFTGDLAMDAEMGNLQLQAEALVQVGQGDLESGANDVNLMAFGGVLDATLDTPALSVGLEGGLASGDGDDTDSRLRTFNFDPDYNVGLILFEQAMPTLAAASATTANDGRSLDHVQLGPAVSNALYLHPRVWRKITDEFEVEAAVLTARTFALSESYGDRKRYGTEFDLTARAFLYDHVELAASGGVLFPGTWFSNYVDEEEGFEGFGDPVFAAQVTSRISF